MYFSFPFLSSSEMSESAPLSLRARGPAPLRLAIRSQLAAFNTSPAFEEPSLHWAVGVSPPLLHDTRSVAMAPRQGKTQRPAGSSCCFAFDVCANAHGLTRKPRTVMCTVAKHRERFSHSPSVRTVGPNSRMACLLQSRPVKKEVRLEAGGGDGQKRGRARKTVG